MARQGKLIIVGGGYLGAGLARRMDAHADVTLVEPREAFVHNSALIRALVQPELLDKVLLPYDKLLRRGRVLHQRATQVHADGVTLANGERLHADAVVVATGSRYALPFKPAGDCVDALRSACLAAHQQLQAAQSVAVVGGGAVGIELAGEIASGMPQLQVSLVHAHQELLPNYPERLSKQLKKQLQSLGVQIYSNCYALRMPQSDAPFSGTLELCTGETLYADMVIPAIGATANNELLTALPGVERTAAGRIRTDAWLRPCPSMPTVFAAGDVADSGDGMTIVATIRQLPWLEKTLRAVLRGQSAQAGSAYKPWPLAPVLLPLGHQIGSSWLPAPIFPSLGVVGSTVTTLIKGKHLFIGKYRKLLGLA